MKVEETFIDPIFITCIPHRLATVTISQSIRNFVLNLNCQFLPSSGSINLNSIPRPVHEIQELESIRSYSFVLVIL